MCVSFASMSTTTETDTPSDSDSAPGKEPTRRRRSSRYAGAGATARPADRHADHRRGRQPDAPPRLRQDDRGRRGRRGGRRQGHRLPALAEQGRPRRRRDGAAVLHGDAGAGHGLDRHRPHRELPGRARLRELPAGARVPEDVDRGVDPRRPDRRALPGLDRAGGGAGAPDVRARDRARRGPRGHRHRLLRAVARRPARGAGDHEPSDAHARRRGQDGRDDAAGITTHPSSLDRGGEPSTETQRPAGPAGTAGRSAARRVSLRRRRPGSPRRRCRGRTAPGRRRPRRGPPA